MKGIFLLLGSNLYDREGNLATAIRKLTEEVGNVARRSSVYETAAWGISDQPDFLNQVVEIETSLSPKNVLQKILVIEKEMGRERLEKWGSRLIDIDILFYNDETIDDHELKVPHPEFKRRNFALVPMAEIAPEELYPGTGETIKFLAENSKDRLFVRIH